MAQIKEIDLKAREIIANVYGHASKVTEQSIASTTRQH
jgi:hypothetical protein